MISEDHCKAILSSYKRTASFEGFAVRLFSNDVLGFLGDHWSLKIFYTEAGTQKYTTFFLKAFPKPSQEHVEYVNQLGVFEKEALLYANLIHHLQTLYEEPFLPKIYFTDRKESIVLEDLDRKGYRITSATLTLEHCEAVLRSLARLHAASFVFEEKQRERIEGYKLSEYFTTEFKEVSFSSDEEHPRNKWCDNVLKAILDCIHTIPEYRKYGRLSENLTDFVKNSIHDIIKPSQVFRNCLTHCDLWSNNMMFRASQNNGLDCVLVDFQFARYIPPVYDVLLTLYLNLSYEKLEDNLDRLLLYYYKHLKTNLAQYKIDVRKIVPISEFWDSVNFYKKLAVVEAAWFGSIAFIGKELAKKIMTNEDVFVEFSYTNRSKYVLREYRTNSEYRMRIEDLLRQIVALFK